MPIKLKSLLILVLVSFSTMVRGQGLPSATCEYFFEPLAFNLFDREKPLKKGQYWGTIEVFNLPKKTIIPILVNMTTELTEITEPARAQISTQSFTIRRNQAKHLLSNHQTKIVVARTSTHESKTSLYRDNSYLGVPIEPTTDGMLVVGNLTLTKASMVFPESPLIVKDFSIRFDDLQWEATSATRPPQPATTSLETAQSNIELERLTLVAKFVRRCSPNSLARNVQNLPPTKHPLSKQKKRPPQTKN